MSLDHVAALLGSSNDAPRGRLLRRADALRDRIRRYLAVFAESLLIPFAGGLHDGRPDTT